MEACARHHHALGVKTFYSSAGLVDRDSGILFLRMTGARMFGMGLWMDVSERVFDHLVGVSERVHRCDRRARLEGICRHQHTPSGRSVDFKYLVDQKRIEGPLSSQNSATPKIKSIMLVMHGTLWGQGRFCRLSDFCPHNPPRHLSLLYPAR